jgi:hypothetical protein
MSPAAVAIALILAWTASSRHARERLLCLVGGDDCGSSSQPANNRVVAFFLFLALLTVLNPEIRALLLFIDAVGVDVFLLLVLLQVQTGFASIHALAHSLWRRMCRWGPLPFHWPTLTTFRRHPAIAICAASPPLAALATVLSISLLAYALARVAVELYV